MQEYASARLWGGGRVVELLVAECGPSRSLREQTQVSFFVMVEMSQLMSVDGPLQLGLLGGLFTEKANVVVVVVVYATLCVPALFPLDCRD